jgi:hypothetical protein
MKVTYSGASSVGVELVLPGGGAVFVEHGASVDVPDEVAQNLLEQGEWIATPTPKKADQADTPKES